MAENFPYFKFIATDWLTGNIVFEPLNVQGLFINICALYWQKDGSLTLTEINKRYKNTSEIDALIPDFIMVQNDNISIEFLDEQLQKANHISLIRKDIGAKGGKAKAIANQLVSKTKQRKEKKKEIKEKENKEENIITFEEFWNLYPVKVNKAKCIEKWNKLSVIEMQEIKIALPEWIKFKPFEKYTHPHPLTFLNGKRWQDEIPEFKPTAKVVLMDNKIDYNVSLENF